MSTHLDITQACPYRGDHLVVALPHLRLVQASLQRDFGLAWLEPTEEDVSEPLGLARLRLRNLDGIGRELRDRVKHHREHGNDRLLALIPPPYAETATDLDRLLFLLRIGFAEGAGGWSPTMAKNYDVETVTGLPHIDGGVSPRAAHFPEVPKAKERPPTTSNHRGVGVRVGIVDTGIQAISALTGRFRAAPGSLLRLRPDGRPVDHWAGHATFIAGLILQQAGGVELDVRQVLSNEHARTTSWDLARRMVEFRGTDVGILTVSAGGYTRDGRAPLVMQRAIDVLTPEIVIVAAAGNHGEEPSDAGVPDKLTSRSPVWPAADDRVVSVGSIAAGATSRQPLLASFNPLAPWQTFVAPGVDLISTYLDGAVRIDKSAERFADGVPEGKCSERTVFHGYARWSGSSFAAAVVAGALAARSRPGPGGARLALERLREESREGVDGIWSYEVAKDWERAAADHEGNR